MGAQQPAALLRGEDSDPENETWTVEEANHCLLRTAPAKGRDPPRLAWCGVNERSPVANRTCACHARCGRSAAGDTEPYALSGEPPLPDTLHKITAIRIAGT